MYAQESGTSFWYQKLSLNRAVFYMVHISSLLSRPTAWWCLLFISLRHPRLYGHVLLHWFSFIFRLTATAANIATGLANSSFMALWG